jgi:hypothetical protein
LDNESSLPKHEDVTSKPFVDPEHQKEEERFYQFRDRVEKGNARVREYQDRYEHKKEVRYNKIINTIALIAALVGVTISGSQLVLDFYSPSISETATNQFDALSTELAALRLALTQLNSNIYINETDSILAKNYSLSDKKYSLLDNRLSAIENDLKNFRKDLNRFYSFSQWFMFSMLSLSIGLIGIAWNMLKKKE